MITPLPSRIVMSDAQTRKSSFRFSGNTDVETLECECSIQVEMVWIGAKVMGDEMGWGSGGRCCLWAERFAIAEEDDDSTEEMTPIRNGANYPVYSTKVFIGGLPYDIDPGKGF
ncbi:unnamed protein product [Litomosoides sigmodontis]|uniref:Uncharacterized protein n=1 Tax=Litomosoides sigmodontis TaxID=42156 RepID=A0A3P6VDK0_LITSI|nr:unnamed protein product [Litomosoides sigmodontis]